MKPTFLSLTDPCKTTVLIVPVGDIKPAAFQKYASLISKFNVINISDITPYFGATGAKSPTFPQEAADNRADEKARFTTNLFKEGSIHFNFITSYDKELAYLEQFQIYRQVLGVIGIIQCQGSTNLSEEYQKFTSTLNQYSTCLVNRCYAFEPSDSQADDTKGVIMIPNVGNVTFYMNTMICDFASSMLNAFGTMAASIESSPAIPSPKSCDKHLSTPAATPSNAFPPAGNFLRSPSPNVDSPTSATSLSTPFSASTPDARVRKRTQGRIYKLVSDLYLMAGKLPDALATYTNAIETTRNNTDFMWHASALEGYYCALILLADIQSTEESATSIPIPIFPSSSFSNSNTGPVVRKSLFGEFVERFRNIIALYDKIDIPCLQVESRLKGAKLLTIILKFGTGEAALNAILDDRIETQPPSGTSAKSHVLKAELMNLLMQSWNIARENISSSYQIRVSSLMAAMCATINYHRKAAYFLRQCALVAAPFIANSELSNSSLRRVKAGLLEGMRRFCDVYGVNVISVPEDEEVEEVDSYGWPDLQVDAIEDCINISDGLSDPEQTINYTIRLLRKYHRALTREEQLRLSFTLQRIVNNKDSPVELTSLTKSISHLPVLKALDVCRPVPARVSYPQRKQKIADAECSSADPFIYNPYAKKSGESIAVPLVVNELSFFDVNLVNPFAFDLDISSIRLSTEGVPFNSISSAAVVPSGSSISLRLSGVPQASGELVLRGCFIRLFGCAEEEFLLHKNREKKNEDKWKIELDHLKRVKQSGLDSTSYRAEKRLSFKRSSAKFTESKFHIVSVIQEQPLLEVTSTNILNNSIMLFEGEKSHVDLVLKNMGTTPIDFLAFSFTDNTIDSPQRNHHYSKETSAESLYEVEIAVHNDPVLSLEEADHNLASGAIKVNLLPGQEHKVTITTYGKRGCTNGNIIINYGYLERADDESDIFYTRQLNLPVLITVNQGLSVLDIELLSFQRLESLDSQSPLKSSTPDGTVRRKDISTIENFVSSRIDRQAKGDYCLMILDIRNVWMLPLEVSIAMNENDTITSDWEQDPNVRCYSTTVHSGCTHRLILPFKRIALSEEILEQPIPNVTNKQYTVPKGPKLTKEEEKLRRTMFWYKQELLKHIHATWVSESFEHRGVLHFREFRLTEAMLESLRKEDITFGASLVDVAGDADKSSQPSAIKQLDANRYSCRPNDILNIQFDIHNHQDIPARLCLRIQPVHDHYNGRLDYELSSFMAFNGPTQTYLQKIPPQKSIQWRLPVTFFSPGEYKILYHGQDVHTRTIHYSSEPLIVEVLDG
ncbi:Trs120-domain-containing protein [Basidiobolus meristosporus CBS 931.73]|uniref:Trs120-domain-containing protein n=1 Tax=Basidiobolus meristosporus CBS 931.73 TaxID=1314790 RepID=A0A1Y1Y685_9FUNG|nr:Trs120-domain-containing protein [Basidiobolus meristosporus CBS 931.73]|eukprot:ORX93503.1 Trs120-domain-containing protein [Basidiobolus meristosporus CBS 931.73]